MSDWINDRTPRAGTHTGRPVAPGTARDHAIQDAVEWRLIVPVKGGPDAKSRLRPPDGVDRLALARALALDTVAAACEAVGALDVVVVTGDADVVHDVERMGVRTVADPGGGLNAAIRAGLDSTAYQPNSGIAVLLGDLPAVRATELVGALSAVGAGGSGFVADAEGTGTVLLASRSERRLEPRFGSGSADAHAGDGHPAITVDAPGLRRDVDDETSLGEALGLGVGPHTARLLAHLIGAP